MKKSVYLSMDQNIKSVIVMAPSGKMTEIPEDVRIGAEITERRITTMDNLERIGTRSNYSCPDCGGAMWQINDDAVTRFRAIRGAYIPVASCFRNSMKTWRNRFGFLSGCSRNDETC